jgi:hypothetical protein
MLFAEKIFSERRFSGPRFSPIITDPGAGGIYFQRFFR